MTYETLGYHETPVRVQFGMVDRYGTLWHGHLPSLCEAARADLARPFELGAVELLKADLAVPMLDLTCQYKAPALDDDALVVESTLLRPTLPMPELRFQYRIVRPSTSSEIARAATRQLVVRANGQVIVRLPEDIRRRLQRLWDYLATRPAWRD